MGSVFINNQKLLQAAVNKANIDCSMTNSLNSVTNIINITSGINIQVFFQKL